MKHLSILQLLYSRRHHISSRQLGQFGLLLVLILAASFAEILSNGVVLPFHAVLTAPDRVFGYVAA